MPGKRYNDETNGQIEILLSCGIPPRKIAADVNIDPSLVYRRRSRLNLFGTVNPPPLSVQGRRRILNREHEEAIEDFLDEYPQAYLAEVAAFIYDEFDLDVHTSTLSRTLSRIRLTNKRIEPVSGVQDEDLRASWMATISQYEAEHLVFLDETACNGRTPNRCYGWSPRGFPCRARRFNTNSKRWSILPALSVEGYLAVDVFQGSFTGERFKSFVSCHVLPRMNPWPLPQSVMICDNASCHDREVRSRPLGWDDVGLIMIGTSSSRRSLRCNSPHAPSLFSKPQSYRGDLPRPQSLYTEASRDGQRVW
jgi:transposase